jgi:hypothetical protein
LEKILVFVREDYEVARMIKNTEFQRRIFQIARFAGIAALAILAMMIIPQPAFAAQQALDTALTIRVIIILIGLLVLMTFAAAAFTLLWRGLFPKKLMWTKEIAARMPWGSFSFGLVATIVILFIVSSLGNFGQIGGMVAFIILSAFLFLFASFGKVAVIEWAGETVDPSAVGLRRSILGAGSLVLLLLIPYFGWAVLAGISMMGIGAAIVSYFPTRSPMSPIDATETSVSVPDAPTEQAE